MNYLGIDLGGTNIAAAVLDADYRIIARAQRKTACPRPAEQIMDDMCAVAREALAAAHLTAEDVPYIGVGCPGMVLTDTGVIVYANNLGFRDVHMGEYMEQRLGRPIVIDNDANAAAYGEYKAGAAKGMKDFIAVTLGTGVGGGVIVDGKLLRGCNGAGAELGHMVTHAGGRTCTCGRRGCLEAYASATGLIRTTKEIMQQHPESAMWAAVGGDIDRVSGRTAFDAMRAGDAAGKAAVDAYIGALAVGVTNYINIFQPDMIALAGGISREGDTLIRPLQALVDKEDYARFSDKRTKLVAATLDNDAGVIGAALLGVR